MIQSSSPIKIWTRLLGTGLTDIARALTLGSDGALYVAGETRGNLDGQISKGDYDAFVTKYNPDGTKSWTRLLGTSYVDSAAALTTGKDGSIYVAGSTYSQSSGYTTGLQLFAKYGADGSTVWNYFLGYRSTAHALTTGKDGSIYVAGWTEAALDFQPFGGAFDGFITKYNPDGTKAWTRLQGTTAVDFADALATGDDGAIYMAGRTRGSLDGQTFSGTTTFDAFITKYNQDGTKAWTKLLGNSEAQALTVGKDGSIYMAGLTYGWLDGQIFSGYMDAFVTKYNPDGSRAWTRLLGTPELDEALGLTTGSDGAIYVTGVTQGYLDGQTNGGGYDAFITRYNPDGTKDWTRLLGTSTRDVSSALTVGNDGAIYLAGNTEGGLDGQTNSGSDDAFISKWMAIDPVQIDSHSITVLANKNILGPDPVLVKDLVEEITTKNGVVTAHTLSYQGIKLNYSDVDSLITTVVRDGDFTEEFRGEIADLYPSLSVISYDDAVGLVGVTSLDAAIISIAGADGNYVG